MVIIEVAKRRRMTKKRSLTRLPSEPRRKDVRKSASGRRSYAPSRKPRSRRRERRPNKKRPIMLTIDLRRLGIRNKVAPI